MPNSAKLTFTIGHTFLSLCIVVKILCPCPYILLSNSSRNRQIVMWKCRSLWKLHFMAFSRSDMHTHECANDCASADAVSANQTRQQWGVSSCASLLTDNWGSSSPKRGLHLHRSQDHSRAENPSKNCSGTASVNGQSWSFVLRCHCCWNNRLPFYCEWSTCCKVRIKDGGQSIPKPAEESFFRIRVY